MIATLADPRDVQLFDDLVSRLGREDGPIGFAAGDANLYRYVGNSPVNFSDPSGLHDGNPFVPPWPEQDQPPKPKPKACFDFWEWHYDRNILNHPPATEKEAINRGWRKVSDFQSTYHRNRGETKNKKYVSPDGHEEGVYDRKGNRVTDTDNSGTFNYIPATIPVGHFVVDMLPYWIKGNSPGDPTPWWDRIFGPTGPVERFPDGPFR